MSIESRNKARDTILDLVSGLDGIEVLAVMLDVVRARRDCAPADLEWVGNQLGRLGWEKERGDN